MLALAAVLYLAGALHWCNFLGLGDPGIIDVADWNLEYRYHSVLREALAEHSIPWHINTTIQGTDRFFGNPEVLYSPQIFLLYWLPIPTFFLVNLLLLYTAGFIGCWMLRRRYRLSAPAFAMLFVLFNFNGHLVAHLCIGHTPWYGYFLLPFFVHEVLRLLDGDEPARASLTLPLILLAIFLQGFFHLFNWCIFFLVLLALWDRSHARALLPAVGLSLPLVAFRLVPAAVAYHGRIYSVTTGYPSPLVLLEAMTVSRGPDTPLIGGFFGILSWWEYDLYVGVLGFVFLVYFGIVRRWRERRAPRCYPSLDAPMLVMTILSINYFYLAFILAQLPFAGAERAPSRFVIVPFVFLLTLSVLRADLLYRSARLSLRARVFIWMAILATAFPLWDHSALWSPRRLVPVEGLALLLANAGPIHIAHRADPVFVAVSLASIAVSATTFAVLLALAIRRRRAST